MKKILILLICLPTLAMAQQKTYVPDDNFETALWSIGLDDGILGNDSVFTSAIDTVKIAGFGGTHDATGVDA